MIHCLHGAVGSHRDWEIFSDQIDQKIHAPDLWQLFKNAAPSLEKAGQKISEQASQGDTLLGYSMGGRLALHALLANPKKWQAAIIISAHPGLTENHQNRLQNDLKWAQLASKNWPEFLTNWNQQSILSQPPPGMHQASHDNQSAVAQSFQNWSLGAQKNLLPRLQDITCPILWLTGQNDPKFTRLASLANTVLPSAQHQIIPDSGHRLPWEQPQKFSQSINTFLASTQKIT